MHAPKCFVISALSIVVAILLVLSDAPVFAAPRPLTLVNSGFEQP